MNKATTNIVIALGIVLAFFAIVMFWLGAGEAQEGALFNFSVDQATVGLRFLFVIVGLLIAFAVTTSPGKMQPGK